MTINDYIYEVYKEKSFSLAAKNLYLSQPALSSAVRKAEQELGITIFDRSTSPISVTEEGKVFIEGIEKIRRISADTIARIHDFTDLKEGHIIISGENYISSFIIPAIVLRFSEKYPNIKIELVESNSPDLRLQLLNESIDLLIAHDFNSALYSSTPLFKETFLLAVPKKFDINKKLSDYALTGEDIENNVHLTDSVSGINLSEFDDMPFILMKKGNDARRRTDIMFNEQNFTPKKVILSLDQLITSYNMASSSLGVALVTDKIIKASDTSNLLFYKLHGRASERYVAIGYKKNKYISNAIKEFINTAKEVFNK